MIQKQVIGADGRPKKILLCPPECEPTETWHSSKQYRGPFFVPQISAGVYNAPRAQTSQSMYYTDSIVSTAPTRDFSIDETEKMHTTGQLRRELEPRVISMLAMGATVGTGLFFGVGSSLRAAGPAFTLVVYVFVGTIVYCVVQALGELCTFIPTVTFTTYNTRFLSRSVGFAAGWLYWWNWASAVPIELAITSRIITYWTSAVPPYVWISVFWTLLVLLNLLPVRVYGETEFWLALVKVGAVAGWILYAVIMLCQGHNSYKPRVFDSSRDAANAFLLALSNAVFTYQGTEMVGVTGGETMDPRKSFPRAINTVFVRIFVFYVLSVLLITLLVAFDDPQLVHHHHMSSFSPFIIAAINCGTPVVPHLLNAVILVSVVSSANSEIYTASRLLYSLSQNNMAPQFLSKTSSHGVPVAAVLTSGAFGSMAYLTVGKSSRRVLNLLIKLTASSGVLAWLLICVSHLRLLAILRSRNMPRDLLPFKSKVMPFGSYYTAVCLTLIIVSQGAATWSEHYAWWDFVAAYTTLLLFCALVVGHKLITRLPWLIALKDADIDTNRLDADIAVWADAEAKLFKYF